MSEQRAQPSAPPAPSPSGGDLHPAFNQAPAPQPAMPVQEPAQPEQNPRARGHSPAMDARQQQQAPAEAMVRFADGSEEKESDVRAWQAEHAEAASRKATLPGSPDAYEIKLPDTFQGPEGVRFEFNQQDPALKAFRDVAAKHGVSQELFSDALAVFASTRMGEAIQQSQLRDANMAQLGTAGPQRVDAVSTWLQARGGADGKMMANFLRQFPSAPIVRTMEHLMRAFSSQGGADFSQSHRAEPEQTGKIPGYDNMSFTQKRVAQMQQQMQRPGRGER